MSEVFQVLDATREMAINGGASYAMVINPEQIQVDENLRDEVLRSFNIRATI